MTYLLSQPSLNLGYFPSSSPASPPRNLARPQCLNWKAASEINNAGFSIERGADGKSWTSISYVSSRAINGNSSAVLDYSFTDATPLSGTLYPNPATSAVNISNVKTGQQLRIVDIEGKAYWTATVTASPQQTSVSNLASGVYFLQVLENGKIASTIKFFKR
ncbi:MAG: T9SS type A sorting domain-containing protein [Chitinophagaceae bacterium]